MCRLVERLIEKGDVESARIIITGRPNRSFELLPGIQWEDHTHINNLKLTIEPGRDIVFIRGGFKPTEFYQWCNDQKIWIMFYAANTGRASWPFWDIVLDDMGPEQNRIDHAGRLWYHFRKPINQDIFRPLARSYIYDVCLGASYIHDKKGQWFGVEMLNDYRQITGKNLKAIMPGAYRHSAQTNQIPRLIKKWGLDVHEPGMVDRAELAEIFNQSRLFLHLGSGQNDRSLIEANACGTPAFVRHEQYHPKFMTRLGSTVNFLAIHPDDPYQCALQLAAIMDLKDIRQETFQWFIQNSDLDTIVYPQFKRLFEFMAETKYANRRKMEELTE
jgi:hypothetical protein